MQFVQAKSGAEFRDTFTTPYDQYKSREGHAFKVLEVITEPENTGCDEETLPMYKIQFDDGEIIEAWPEEVLNGNML